VRLFSLFLLKNAFIIYARAHASARRATVKELIGFAVRTSTVIQVRDPVSPNPAIAGNPFMTSSLSRLVNHQAITRNSGFLKNNVSIKYDEARVRVVELRDLEAWLTELFNTSNKVGISETHNNQDYYFSNIGSGIAVPSRRDLNYLQQIKRYQQIEMDKIPRVLECLVAAGYLEPGNYLVRVSW
jgi:hypothetical protein